MIGLAICAVFCAAAFVGAITAMVTERLHPDDALALGIAAAFGFNVFFLELCRGG